MNWCQSEAGFVSFTEVTTHQITFAGKSGAETMTRSVLGRNVPSSGLISALLALKF